MYRSYLGQTQQALIGRLIDARIGEIVEGPAGRLDDVASDEGGALGGALVAALDAAFPFEHGPAGKVVLGELGKNAAEIDLSVTQRTEPAGPVDPGLEPAIDALPL